MPALGLVAAPASSLAATAAISARQAMHRLVGGGGGYRPQPLNALQCSSAASTDLRCACMLRQLCMEARTPDETCEAVVCVP